jgi:DegV family protein with EDD domain
MSTVTVVTDTTHSMPAAQLEREGVQQVSLHVNHGSDTQREADMDLGAFYDRLRTDATLPKTAAPSIGEFLAVYEPLLDAGQDIVSVHLSGGLSGTVDIARQAADDALADRPDRRIEIIDSRSVAGGLALIVLAAAAGARLGEDAVTVAARTRDAVRDTRIWFAVDTLEFLQKGGRVGTAAAWLGGALKIKPILTVQDGEVSPIERVRTSGRAFERLVTAMDDRVADGATGWAVQHIQAPAEAERLVARGREIFGCEPSLVSEIGPVVGTYAGPGLLGVAGLPPALLGR